MRDSFSLSWCIAWIFISAPCGTSVCWQRYHALARLLERESRQATVTWQGGTGLNRKRAFSCRQFAGVRVSFVNIYLSTFDQEKKNEEAHAYSLALYYCEFSAPAESYTIKSRRMSLKSLLLGGLHSRAGFMQMVAYICCWCCAFGSRWKATLFLLCSLWKKSLLREQL